jgi:hypothetical protein
MSRFSHFLHSALVFEVRCLTLTREYLTMHLEQSGCLTVSSSKFQNCSTTWNGGAISVEVTAPQPAADPILVVRDGCVFASCSSGQSGGAIYAHVQHLVTVNLAFFGECKAGGTGGSIYAKSSGRLDLSCNTLKAAESQAHGGGICAIGRDVNISFCVFSDCLAKLSGGGLYAEADNPQLAPLLTVVHTNFTGCLAGQGWSMMLSGFAFNMSQTIFELPRCDGDRCHAEQECVRVEQLSHGVPLRCNIVSAYFGYPNEGAAPRDFMFIRGNFTYESESCGDVFWNGGGAANDHLFSPLDKRHLRAWPLADWAIKARWQNVWPQDIVPLDRRSTRAREVMAARLLQSESEMTGPFSATATATATATGTGEPATGGGSAAGLGTAVIVFIVIACLLFIAIVAIVLCLCLKRAGCCDGIGSDGERVTYF